MITQYRYLFVALLFLFSSRLFAVETIYINHPLSQLDTRYEYPRLLLERILQVTESEYGPFYLTTNGISMNRDRALASLIDGKTLHVMAEAPKPDWNSQLLSVRIPIRKGIQGFRIFLTKEEHIETLSNIHDLAGFKALPTGSGEQWSTTRVLEEAGFNVVKGVDYEGLFGMLVRNRFITFGRGINEIFDEWELHKTQLPSLTIDERFLLYIPLPTYYFVSPQKPELRNRIEKGLKQLIKTGEFEKIFMAEFGKVIEKAKLDKRIRFAIPNPNLGPEDPLEIEHYWFFNSAQSDSTNAEP